MRTRTFINSLVLPLLVGFPILLILVASWGVQQRNINSLAQQITNLKQQIDALPATVTPKDKLALEKDRLTLEKDRVNAENANYGTLVQAVGGAFFFVTAYLTWRNVKATEEKQVTERFSKAVEMLGSDKLEVRLGAIYALERIAKDSEKDYWTVIEVLTGFVRECSHSEPETEKADTLSSVQMVDGKNQLPTDIKAVLTVLNRRQSFNSQEKALPDLSRSDFSWMILRGVSFKGINLWGANFQGADLITADLRETFLAQANFSRAALSGANLSGASLSRADFSGAALVNTNLSGAVLKEVDFSGAALNGALLNGADLGGANLSGAYFLEIDLSVTIGLTQEQISKAITNEKTKLPDYLQAPKPSQPELPES